MQNLPLLFRIAIADQEYSKAFEDELEAFKTRIRNRAIEKLKEQIEEAKQEEEIERQSRLGPGGLDPVEVFESLPKVSTNYNLGIKIRNLKVDFKTGGTWRWVGQ